MRDMGIYFEPPPRADKHGWAKMRLLAEQGYRFGTTGGKPLLLGSWPGSVRELRRRLSTGEETEESGLLVRAQRDKKSRKSMARLRRRELRQ